MNSYPRVLTVQDISCVGQCSLTVALPVLSACGTECCVLPTAVLSAHTGFADPEIHKIQETEKFLNHWRRAGIRFDAILTGYLGSMEAVDAVLKYAGQLLNPEGRLIVDPAMADRGRMYRGLSDAYAGKMQSLCAQADIVLPNVTESEMLGPVLKNKTRIITGEERQGKIGIRILEQGREHCFLHEKIPGHFSGTGDLFAACFTGALCRGMEVCEASCLAERFTYRCVAASLGDERGYGVRFEPELAWLTKQFSA